MEDPRNDTPKISVIIPVYNMAAYLEEAVGSLRTQTMADWEAVCVDDGSTDAGAGMLDRYAAEDPRIRVIHQENRGVGAARNRGIDSARGQFLFFLDPDDRIADGNVFSDLYEAAVNNSVRICGGSFREFSGTKVKSEWKGLNAPYTFPEDRRYTYREYQFDYGWVRFLYERRFLNENGLRLPEYTYFEDPVFFVRAMDRAGEFYALKRPVYCYRTGYKSTELSYPKTLDLVRGFRDNFAFAAERGYSALTELEKTRFRTEYAQRVLRYAHEEQAGELRALLDEVNGVLYPDGSDRIEYSMYRYLLDREQARQQKTAQELDRLRQSPSWKIGRALTAIPRLLKRLAGRLSARR